MSQPTNVTEPVVDQDDMIRPPKAYHVVRMIESFMADAFEQAAQAHDTRLNWCLGTTPMDTGRVDDQGNHQYITLLTIYVAIPDPSVESGYLSSTAIYPLEGWETQEAQKVAQQLVSQLVESLPEAAAQREAAQAQAASQGRTPPGSGLIKTNGQPDAVSDEDVDTETVNAWARGE